MNPLFYTMVPRRAEADKLLSLLIDDWLLRARCAVCALPCCLAQVHGARFHHLLLLYGRLWLWICVRLPAVWVAADKSQIQEWRFAAVSASVMRSVDLLVPIVRYVRRVGCPARYVRVLLSMYAIISWFGPLIYEVKIGRMESILRILVL